MAKPADEDARVQVLREFEERLKGLDLPQLQALTQSLLAFGRQTAEAQIAERRLLAARRPERRRPRRDVEVTYRIRADLRDTKPPVWRRLDVNSSLLLDELHAVLQAAFGFTDSHRAGGPALRRHPRRAFEERRRGLDRPQLQAAVT